MIMIPVGLDKEWYYWLSWLWIGLPEDVRDYLYDMAAAAIVKTPSWASVKEMPAPILQNNTQVERPGNPHKIKVWENFEKDAILEDFYNTMEHYVLAGSE